MATLSLFRHAKAEQAVPGQEDFDRKLTERGRKDAAQMGELLADLDVDLAIVSPSARTRETCEMATHAWKKAPKVVFDKQLYLCRPSALIARIRQVPEKAESVVLVGHNPCWQEVALALAGDARAAAAMRVKFPTAALAVFKVDGSWAELEPERTTLKRFATPATVA